MLTVFTSRQLRVNSGDIFNCNSMSCVYQILSTKQNDSPITGGCVLLPNDHPQHAIFQLKLDDKVFYDRRLGLIHYSCTFLGEKKENDNNISNNLFFPRQFKSFSPG